MRKKLVGEPKEATLEQLVPQYGKDNAQFNQLKKVVDAEKKDIKELMTKQCITETENYGGFKAVLTTRATESFNEEALIAYLRENFSSVCNRYKLIKTQLYIDMDAFENALYHNEFGENVANFNRFKQTKETTVLNVREML